MLFCLSVIIEGQRKYMDSNVRLRESSFNMTRGGDEDIEGRWLQKFLDTRKGGSEKLEGALKN